MLKQTITILALVLVSFGVSATDQDVRDLLDAGIASLENNEPDKAITITMQAYQLAKKRNDRYSMTKARGNMGYISKQVGDYAAAQVNIGEALKNQRELDTVDLYRETLYLSYLAEISHKQGDYRRSANIYEAALESATNYIDAHPDTAAFYNDTDWLYILPLQQALALKELGEYKEAGDILLALMEQTEGMKFNDEIAQIHNHLGLMRMDGEKYLSAQNSFGKVAFTTDAISDWTRAIALHNLAWSYMEQEDFVKAELYYKSALAIKDSISASASSKFITLLDLGELKLRQEKFEEAIAYWNDALLVHEGIHEDPKAFKIYDFMVQAHSAIGSEKSDEFAALYTSTMSTWIEDQEERKANPELAIFNTRIDNIIAAREASARRVLDIKRYWPFAAMALVTLIFMIYQLQVFFSKRRESIYENQLRTDRALKADEILKQIRRD